ncbi:MAG: hypothetical protein OEV06_06985 [Anaerolineae bacterium]|nr:hypothetical protein [Anaerolineae bacterium]
MYEKIFAHLRLRCDELLASAETARLLERSRDALMSRAAQIAALEEHQSASPVSYTLAAGQGREVLKTPHTDQLLAGARKDDPDSDVLEEVIFFTKSVF